MLLVRNTLFPSRLGLSQQGTHTILCVECAGVQEEESIFPLAHCSLKGYLKVSRMHIKALVKNFISFWQHNCIAVTWLSSWQELVDPDNLRLVIFSFLTSKKTHCCDPEPCREPSQKSCPGSCPDFPFMNEAAKQGEGIIKTHYFPESQQPVHRRETTDRKKCFARK